MASLLTEYYRRKGVPFVMPTNGGLCFFNKNDKPSLICHTSVTPKSSTCCLQCGRGDITIEILQSHPISFQCNYHEHITPDADLVKEVNKFDKYVTPVYIENSRNIEIWLWNFHLSNDLTYRSRTLDKWINQQSTTEEPLRSYEQMMHCSIYHAKFFKNYYSMYQIATNGRKYLIFN